MQLFRLLCHFTFIKYYGMVSGPFIFIETQTVMNKKQSSEDFKLKEEDLQSSSDKGWNAFIWNQLLILSFLLSLSWYMIQIRLKVCLSWVKVSCVYVGDWEPALTSSLTRFPQTSPRRSSPQNRMFSIRTSWHISVVTNKTVCSGSFLEAGERRTQAAADVSCRRF